MPTWESWCAHSTRRTGRSMVSSTAPVSNPLVPLLSRAVRGRGMSWRLSVCTFPLSSDHRRSQLAPAPDARDPTGQVSTDTGRQPAGHLLALQPLPPGRPEPEQSERSAEGRVGHRVSRQAGARSNQRWDRGTDSLRATLQECGLDGEPSGAEQHVRLRTSASSLFGSPLRHRGLRR